MNRLIISVVLLFTCVIAHAQTTNNDFEIDITATSSFHGTNMLINIKKHADSIKLIYRLLDSVNNKGLFKDKRYNELEKYAEAPLNITTNKDSLRLIYKELNEIDTRYTYYNADSLEIGTRRDTTYTRLLTEVCTTSTDSLENTKINKDRAVFDGTVFDFKIRINHTDRNIFAHSPMPKSHPILYALLNQTIDIYRRIKVNSFLNSNRTDGY